MNPLSETWEAVKARLGGPFGAFVVVWNLCHPKVIAYAVFDAVARDTKDVSSAEAKINKISEALGGQSRWTLFFRPLLWTFIALLVFQVLGLLWHYIGEWFRYWNERVTAQKNFRIYIFQRMGTKGEEALKAISAEIDGAKKMTQSMSQNMQGIGGTPEGIVAATRHHVQVHTQEIATRLERARSALELASEEPLLQAFDRYRKHSTSDPSKKVP